MKLTCDKKLKTIIALILAATFIISFPFILSSCSRSESPEKGSMKDSLKQSGPLLEQGGKVLSLSDELGEKANDPEALANLGDNYFEGGKFAEAVDIYNKVLSLAPDDVDTYNDLGLAYAYLNQIDKSIETLQKGAEIMPSYQRIWISLGFVSVSSGKNELARTALTTAVELGPDTTVGKEASKMLKEIK